MTTQYVEIWGIRRSLAFAATYTRIILTLKTDLVFSFFYSSGSYRYLLALAPEIERAGIRSTALPFVYTFSFGAFAGCTELMLLFPLGKYAISTLI